MSETILGSFIRKNRKRKGLTQDQLANMAGTTKAAISRYEKGQRIPNIYIFSRIITCLKIGADQIIPLLSMCSMEDES